MSSKEWRRRDLVLFLFFSTVGFLVLFWSANDWYELAVGERMGASFCSINAYWNCDRATMSPLGSWFSIPVGVFGMFWFWMVGVCGLSLSASKIALRIWLVLGLLTVAAYSYYLTAVLKVGCLVCYMAYACVLGASIFGWRLSARKNPRPTPFLSSKSAVFFSSLGFFSIGLFAFVHTNKLSRVISEEEFKVWYASLSISEIPLVSPFAKGPDNASIVVLEFSDFGCPHCERAATTMIPYLTAQPDVKVMFYPFPIDSACNPAVAQSVHPRACDWARGGLCALKQDQFWTLHDTAFAQLREQNELPALSEWIHRLKLKDVEAFKACLEAPETEAQLKELIAVGNRVQIDSTPTFFVNGRRVQGAVLPLMRRLVEELRK